MFQEFKNFINKGNVLDLAVAVVLGAAFGEIISSLVADIIMPVIGSIFNINFIDWKYMLEQAVVGADGKEITPAIYFRIGKFIQSIVDFFLVAIPVFLIVKAAAKARMSAGPPPLPAPSPSEILLGEIRDLLKK